MSPSRKNKRASHLQWVIRYAPNLPQLLDSPSLKPEESYWRSPFLTAGLAMSGAGEAVGVALAVLPLIIKAVESYEKIGDLVSTYRKYSKVVERFNIQLSTQKTIFRNECVLLLSDVGDDAKWRMHEIFSENRPATSIRPIFLTRDEHLWTDERIFERMNEREHDSYKQLAALLGLIGETLELISEETQRYRQEQLGDNASRPNVSNLITGLP